MLIMRELTGGLYFGERHTMTENGVRKAVDTLTYTEELIGVVAIREALGDAKGAGAHRRTGQVACDALAPTAIQDAVFEVTTTR